MLIACPLEQEADGRRMEALFASTGVGAPGLGFALML
jgi:hypothetical protein